MSLAQPVAMFLAVWILYAADRLLDAKPLFTAPNGPELRDRHHFHHRHRRGMLWTMVAVLVPLLFLLHHMQEATLHLYVLLGGLLCAWLLLVHARPEPAVSAHRLPKELAVSLFFTAAVFIPTLAGAHGRRTALALPAVLFALVCGLNCLMLFAWEHPARRGNAHRTTQWALAHLQGIAVMASLLPCALVLASPLWNGSGDAPALPHAAVVYLACGSSSFLLLLLHFGRHRIPRLRLRALADLVLLTPVPLWLGTLALRHLA